MRSLRRRADFGCGRESDEASRDVACNWLQLARTSRYGAASLRSIDSGFALLGDSLFSNAKKVSKNACPCIRVSLRSTALIPSLLRGSPRKGHPWPFTALAASMPLAPLRSDSVRPPERGVRRRLIARLSATKQSAFVSLFTIFQAARSRLPFRRPSAGVAQGGARHGCLARSDGSGPPSAWMSLRDGPRSSTGAREVLRSKTRMQVWSSFWLLFLGHTRKSDAPCKAQTAVPAEESAAPHSDARATANTRPAFSCEQKTHPNESHIASQPNRQRRSPYINPDAPQLRSRGDHP